jgi:hypothetical protein
VSSLFSFIILIYVKDLSVYRVSSFVAHTLFSDIRPMIVLSKGTCIFFCFRLALVPVVLQGYVRTSDCASILYVKLVGGFDCIHICNLTLCHRKEACTGRFMFKWCACL